MREQLLAGPAGRGRPPVNSNSTAKTAKKVYKVMEEIDETGSGGERNAGGGGGGSSGFADIFSTQKRGGELELVS